MRIAQKLNAKKIAELSFLDKPYRVYDGGNVGLYILVTSTAKTWRFEFKNKDTNKVKTITLGKHPLLSINEVRIKYLVLREQFIRHVNPAVSTIQHTLLPEMSFGFFANQFLDNNKELWTYKNYCMAQARIKNYLGDFLSRDIRYISAKDCYSLLKEIENTGKTDTVYRVKSLISRIMRYAVIHSSLERDVTVDIKGALKPVKTTHWAYMSDPNELGKLLKKVKANCSDMVSVYIQLMAHLFVRPGELRWARVEQFDFDDKIWRIPAQQMKMKRPHLVPLSDHAIDLIKSIIDDDTVSLLFPSTLKIGYPICDNTAPKNLRTLGYARHEMSVHGFRATASTLLHEKGYESIIIERQLAHTDRNRVRAAYNHAEFISQRREMMQYWSDYLVKISS